MKKINGRIPDAGILLTQRLNRIFHILTGGMAHRSVVAQVSNLLYRRLPVGRLSASGRWPAGWKPAIQQIGNLRYAGRLKWTWEICGLGRMASIPAVRVLLLTVLAALALGSGQTSPAPEALTRVASWPGFGRGPAYDVATAGHYAYVAIDEGGLLILDVTDPAQPVRVGGYQPPGRAQVVRVQGSRLFLGSLVHRGAGCEAEGWRGYVAILDINEPTHPVPLGYYVTSASVQSLFVEGNRLYIGNSEANGDEENALHIVDVSNPARPVALSTLQTRPAPLAASGGDNVAYVGSSDTLKILDVSQPTAPREMTNLTSLTDGRISGLQVVGQLLYMVRTRTDGEMGGWLTISSITNSSAPQTLGSLALDHAVTDCQVSGDYAYLATADGGLTVVDVHDPRAPVRVGGYRTPGIALRVAVFGGHALVAAYTGGLQIIDVRDPVHPAAEASFDTGLTTRMIRLAGDKVYLLSSDRFFYPRECARSRVEVVSVSDPTRPALLGLYDSDLAIGGLSTANDVVYFAWNHADKAGLGIVDFRDPARPAPRAILTNSPSRDAATGVGVDGHFVFVTTGLLWDTPPHGRLQVFDVTDLSRPLLVSTTESTNSSLGVGLANHRAYVVSSSTLDILEITHPQAPAPMGSVIFNQTANRLGGLAVCGDYAYVGLGWPGFSIVDVRQPANPVVAAQYDTDEEVLDLGINGHYAYLAEGWAGLEVLDVSDPTQPVPAARFPTRGQACGVQVASNYAYVAEGGSGLAIFGLNPAPVTMVAPPAAVSAALGDTATLTVRAYGAGPLSYQWYVGESGDTSHPLAGATTDSLTTSKLAQATDYWVWVSSDAGASNSPAARVSLVTPVAVELLNLCPGQRDATNGFAQDVAVSGDYAYLADSGGGLKILDVREPKAPTLAGIYRPSGDARHVAVAPQFVYLAADAGEVLDVSDPIHPKRIASTDSAGDVFLSGGYGYFTGAGAGVVLWTLDLRDPAAPRLMPATLLPSTWRTQGGAVFGRYAAVAQGWSGLQILDLNVPGQPVWITGYYPEDPVAEVAMSTNFACITLQPDKASRSPSLEVIDLRDPQRPVRTARVSLPVAHNVALSGGYAYVTGDGLQVLDLSDLWKPVRVGSHQLGAETWGLQVIGDLVYVAAGQYGLAIYRLTPQLRLQTPVVNANGIHLSWLPAPAIRLQSATTLSTSGWQEVPNSEGVSSLQLSPTNACRFFRLVRP